MEERRGWRERKGGEERDEKKRKKKQRRMKGASIGPQESQPSILEMDLEKGHMALALPSLWFCFPEKFSLHPSIYLFVVCFFFCLSNL